LAKGATFTYTVSDLPLALRPLAYLVFALTVWGGLQIFNRLLPHLYHARIGFWSKVAWLCVSLNETDILKRNTTSPRMDFVVLPLTPEAIPEIEKVIVSRVAFKGSDGIVHVQIERQGRLAFVACDNFHEDCVWVSEAVPATFLAELVKNRVLYSTHLHSCRKIAISLTTDRPSGVGPDSQLV
jgi:hypothetical protein